MIRSPSDLTCTVCGASSEAVRLYAAVKRRCADCHKARMKALRDASPEIYRARDAARHQRDWIKRRALHDAYRATERGKAAMREGQAAYVARYPERRAARVAVGNALRSGRMQRPATCSACGGVTRLHAHHDDCSRPLDVRWLCVPCHEVAHHGPSAACAMVGR